MNDEHPIVWNDERVARLWDFYARSAHVASQYFATVYGGYVLRRAGLPARAPLRVVDFGCGSGGMWDHMKRAGVKWRYTGLDFSAATVAKLHQRCASDPGFDDAVLVREMPSPLRASDFDAAFLLEVVEHLSDDRLDSTLAEIARLLKPGGRLVLSTPHDEDLSIESRYCPECEAVFHQWQHVRSWTPEAVRAAVAKHGLEHKSTWCGHWDDHWLGGWLFNRAAHYWRGRRKDPHMLLCFEKPATSNRLNA